MQQRLVMLIIEFVREAAAATKTMVFNNTELELVGGTYAARAGNAARKAVKISLISRERAADMLLHGVTGDLLLDPMRSTKRFQPIRSSSTAHKAS
jgi:hypothetical protein